MQQNETLQPAHPRRTSKACTTCHARKTRCDALSAGLPCRHCREGGFECQLQPRKKRRSKMALRLADNEHHESGASSSVSANNNNSTLGQQPHQTQPSQPSAATAATALTPTQRVAFPEHVMRHQIPHFSFFSRLALVHKAPAARRTTTTTTTTTTTKETDGDGDGLVLPIAPYNQWTDGSLYGAKERAQDEQFLRSKGAFSLPPREALDDCVATYFRVFHPFFPVVDRPAFLAKYRETPNSDLVRDGKGPSLLLLQSIVFTASAFVDTPCLTKMGFASRHQARSVLHARAKHLHQFGWEPDDIATIQSLLLMSHYYASMADQRHTWLWAHQAIGLAQGAGLHRAHAHAHEGEGEAQSQESRLWKRIWWECLVRDRLIALGTRRPMHINSLDCNVPLPTAADLDEEDDTDDDRATKAIFVEFLKLCHYMEGVLSLSLSPSPNRDGASLAHDVALCRSTLANWAASQSQSPPARSQPTKDGSDGSIPFLYHTLVRLMHNVVLSTLIQTGGSVYHGNDNDNNRDHDPLVGQRVPSTEMQSLAQDSTRLLDGLIKRSLIKYCPTQIVTAVMPVLIVQFLLMRGGDGGTDDTASRQAATRDFNTCMAALGELGLTYWHAQFYHDFLQLAAVAERTRVRGQDSRRRAKQTKDGKVAKSRRKRTETQTATGTTATAVDTTAVDATATDSITPTAADTTDTAESADTISPLHNFGQMGQHGQHGQPDQPDQSFEAMQVQNDATAPPPPLMPPLLGGGETVSAWPVGDWMQATDGVGLGVGDISVGDLSYGNAMDSSVQPFSWDGLQGDQADLGDLWTADQVMLFDDWLNDDALFQSLFPSA